MARGKSARSKPRLMLLLSLLTGAILLVNALLLSFSFRYLLTGFYFNTLRKELTQGLETLERNDYQAAALPQLHRRGIRVIVIRQADRSLVFSDLEELDVPPPKEGPEEETDSDHLQRDIGRLIQEVDTALEERDGSLFSTNTDRNPSPRHFPLSSRSMLLLGRENGYYYLLHLPIESTNTAISLASRFVLIINLISWLLSLGGLYYCTRLLLRPMDEIVQISTQVARLDFSRRCGEAHSLEINEMARSINQMADQLQSNITQLQQSNDLLQQELARRTRQQQLTTELIANLSHDLKTPIAVISGYAEGLLEGVAQTETQRQRYVSTIVEESEHMQVLVSKLLAISRVESGEIPIKPESFDLVPLVDQVLTLFQPEIQRRHIRLERTLPPALPVFTDYESIRQVLINYVQNAVFHLNGGNLIRLWYESGAEGSRLCVANSSAPIPAEELPKIWDKLYRGDAARQRSHGEAGLGLSIVKGNLDRLGLGCGCENLPDGLVMFWLELPEPPK